MNSRSKKVGSAAGGPAVKFLGDSVLASEDSGPGERKQVTVLAGDIVDYSSIARKLSPEQAYKVMAHCLTILGDEISHRGGTMTQVTGGIVRGIFGVPVSYEDHAKRACEAALSILETFNDYAEKLRAEKEVSLELRIWLASGLVLAGPVVSGAAIDYRDLEGVDDLIHMVQALLKPGKAVAMKSTYDLASDFFEFQRLEAIGERGIRPIEAYELLRSQGLVSRILAKERRGLSKFVGRNGEMSILLEAAQKAREGFGQVCAIMGDAGVGKSRLVFEFRKALPEEQQIYLEGYCRSYDGVPAYHPFLDILKSFFAIEMGEKAGAIKKKIRNRLTGLMGGYEEIIAPIHEIFVLDVEDTQYLRLGFQEKRSRIFKAIEDLFIEISREELLVLVIEDLHWIDRSSEELLSHLIGKISNTRILLILPHRPECAGGSLLSSTLTTVHLAELVENHARELTESVLGGCKADDNLVASVWDQTAGNPLFIEELTMALLDRAAIREVEGKFILAKDAPTQLLPKTVEGVISARMDRLEKDVKTTLQVASVIGREVPLSILEEVLETGEALKSHIPRLMGLGFLHETAGSLQRQFEFKHALTQETVYSSLLSQSRESIHQKVGGAIERLYSDRLEDFYEPLAYHFSMSHNLEKECQYLKLAAGKANRQNSAWEAFHFTSEALRSLQKQKSSQERKREEIEVLTIVHWILRMLDYAPENSEQLLKRGEQLSLEIGDQKSISLFRAALCIYYFAKGDAISCRKYSDFLFSDKGTNENTILTKDLLKIVVPTALENCLSGFVSARFSETLSTNLKIIESMEEADVLLESYGTPYNSYSFLAAASAFFASWLGDFDNAMILCQKALRVARETNNLFSLGYAEQAYGMTLSHRGYGHEAIDYLLKSIGHLEEAGAGVTFGVTSWNLLAYSYFLVENLDDARRCFEKAIKMQLDSGILFFLSSIYANLSMVHLAAGDLASARSCVDSALEWAQKCNEKHWEGLTKIFFGRIIAASELLQSGNAESSILEGIEILTKLGVRPYYALGYAILGELYLGAGRTHLGIKTVKKAEKMFRQMGMDYWVRITQKALDRF